MNVSSAAQRLSQLAGLRRYAAAFLAGALLTLVFPPVGFSPLLFICVPAFAVLARAALTRRQAFFTGWAFGAGFFIAGLYWISAALFVDIVQWGWVLPFSLILGPGLFGLYYGFIPLLAWPWRASPALHAWAIVLGWAAVDYARGHLLTGFPWNLPGYGWPHLLALEQVSSIGGVYLLSLLTLLWAMLPLLRPQKKLFYASAILFIFCLVWGGTRLITTPTQPTETLVRIVQPNIPQDKKWDSDSEWRNFEKGVLLARRADGPQPDVLVWPETAVNGDFELFPELASFLTKGMKPGSHAIVGNLRVRETFGGYQFFNSMTVLDSSGRVAAIYDKHHLVPFGEYIPYRDQLKIAPLAAAVSGIGDFTRGTGPAVLTDAGLPPASPQICYEVIFPRAVTPRSGGADAPRAAWLVNATNDAWYGRSSGPYQHLHISRMRAIEEGLPLARAANTGISAMIDPLGRIVASQPLMTDGVVDTPLPAPLPPTVYSRFGDLLFWLALVFLSLPLLPIVRRKS